MVGNTYKPLAVSVVKSGQTIHVRPEDQSTGNHVEGNAEQIRLAIMAALHQKPGDEKQILEVLQINYKFGVKCGARYIQVTQIVRVVLYDRRILGKQGKLAFLQLPTTRSVMFWETLGRYWPAIE